METHSFASLFKDNDVIIPMIQRDYAFGREFEEEKRDNFLKSLRRYFEEPGNHILDFIYGSKDGNTIILLDGQQRITTLYLLHWYLSLIETSAGGDNYSAFQNLVRKSNTESKFSYRTRFSSIDFCNALVNLDEGQLAKYTKCINSGSGNLKQLIEKDKWFLSHWNNDPTVTSMLTMLNSIMENFPASTCENYYELLTVNNKLEFNFLDLKTFDLSDELYIKMNSRGKPLTRFENLKSMILRLCDVAKATSLLEYNKRWAEIQKRYSDAKRFSSLREYISHMLDSQWTDIFWGQWLNNSKGSGAPVIDDTMLSYIAIIAIFNHADFILGNESITRTDAKNLDIETLLGSKNAEDGITIRYDRFLELFCENKFNLLYKIVDYFNVFNDSGKLRSYFNPSYYRYNDESEFREIINDYKKSSPDYERKIKFYAFTKYLTEVENINQAKLEDWMRFIYNVCSNTEYNNVTDFCNCIAGINTLFDEDIRATLPIKSYVNVITLNKAQIDEEKLKVQLSKDSNWDKALLEAEDKAVYLLGRLSYALKDLCNIDIFSIGNLADINRFKSVIDKIVSIFPDKDGCKFEENLIRALLCKGDYLVDYKYSKSLLKNNIYARDISWRSFLSANKNDRGADSRQAFTDLINDSDFNVRDCLKGLNTIINNVSYIGMPLWRQCIIKNPELLNGEFCGFSLGQDRCLRWNKADGAQLSHKQDDEDNCEIDLISKVKLSSAHAELFTLTKYIDLKKKTFGANGVVEYVTTTTETEQPYISVCVNGNEMMKVYYQDDQQFRVETCSSGAVTSNVNWASLESELQTKAASLGI